MKLNELFDKPLPYTKQDDRNYFFSYKGVDYELRLDNHTLEEKDVPPEIIESINFDNTITIKLGIQDSDDPSRIANFEENDIKFKVLATVYDIIYKYITEHQPEAVLLKSFDEPSRIRFYDTLSDRLAEKFNYKKDAKNGLFTLYDESLEKGSENLNEAIDQPVDFKFRENTPNVKSYVFIIEGEEIEIKFTKLQSPPFKNIYPDADYSSFWSVVFYVDDDMQGKFGVNQNTFKIFATLKTIVENFIDDFNPTGLWAAANDIKKFNLYKKLLKGKIESKFERSNDDGNKELIVYNTDDEQTINEAFDKVANFKTRKDGDKEKIFEFFVQNSKISVRFTWQDSQFIREELPYLDDRNFYQVDFKVDETYKKNDDLAAKNSFIIAATMINIIDYVIDEEEISALLAIALNGKKFELYKKLFQSHFLKYFDKFKVIGDFIILYDMERNF